MSQKPNYGFPLSFIIVQIFLILLIVLVLIMFILSENHIFTLLIAGSSILFISLLFGIIFFNKHFLKNRLKLLNKMIKIANLKGNETVLDLGTGSGFLMIGFAKKLKYGKSIGVDKYSFKSDDLITKIFAFIRINFIGNTLKIVKNNVKIEKVEDKCEILQADITKKLNFPDRYFDIIVSCQFFYCIYNKKRQIIYEEVNRILKKGGKIIFFESKSFMDWDINELKVFFENIGYNVELTKINEFKKCIILSGQKK